MRKIVDMQVVSDLYEVGPCEDGMYTAEQYFVAVEFEGGEVYAHNMIFKGCAVERIEGEPMFIDCRELALQRVGRLYRRVFEAWQAGQELNMEHWHLYRTVYGTPAYENEVAGMTPEQRRE